MKSKVEKFCRETAFVNWVRKVRINEPFSAFASRNGMKPLSLLFFLKCIDPQSQSTPQVTMSDSRGPIYLFNPALSSDSSQIKELNDTKIRIFVHLLNWCCPSRTQRV